MSLKALRNINNARDLADACPSIAPGLVMRCANPSDASFEDVTLLLDRLGIRDLIDLRSAEEFEEESLRSELFRRTRTLQYVRGWWGQQLQAIESDVNITTPSHSHSQQHPQAASASTSAAADGAASSPLLSPSGTNSSNGGQQQQQQEPPGGEHAARHAGAPCATRHHISLLERGRYYAGLVSRIPLTTTLAALLLAPFDLQRAKGLLLVHINAGGLPMMYQMLLDGSQPEIRAALEVVLAALEGGRPVLFFCKAGKDRTGLVAAALLACAGASEQQILDDYFKSDAYHRVALAGLERREELAALDFKKFERAPREVMHQTLQYLQRRYGGFGPYLKAIGFGPEKQQRLKQRLTFGANQAS